MLQRFYDALKDPLEAFCLWHFKSEHLTLYALTHFSLFKIVFAYVLDKTGSLSVQTI